MAAAVTNKIVVLGDNFRTKFASGQVALKKYSIAKSTLVKFTMAAEQIDVEAAAVFFTGKAN